MLVLNNSVGGLNPVAVDIAGRLGTKVVSLPTVNSANELENISGQRDESKLPYWMGIARAMQARGIAGEWIRVVDEQGRVSQAARQCFEVIASYDMLLATGHIAPREMLPTITAAKEAGVQRLLITHPEFPTTRLDIDQQHELARQGVFFERCFTTPHTGKIPWEAVFENIRQVGPDSTILATDLGQSTAPWPDEGLEIFIGKLLDVGFSESDVRRMVRDNAAQLLGVSSGAQRQTVSA
jgi:sugar phosphate isomerase/epimerase